MTTNTATALRDAVRSFNKHVLNPLMLPLAGHKHWYAAVIRHRGRRTGKHYSTPVVAERTPDGGFVVPLPYGAGVDWLRNVIAAGQATITAGGVTYAITRPEIIDSSAAAAQLPARPRRIFQPTGIKSFVKFTLAG